jgi:hypothetical protein
MTILNKFEHVYQMIELDCAASMKPEITGAQSHGWSRRTALVDSVICSLVWKTGWSFCTGSEANGFSATLLRPAMRPPLESKKRLSPLQNPRSSAPPPRGFVFVVKNVIVFVILRSMTGINEKASEARGHAYLEHHRM